ncbi:MAG: hypothetical protein DHS20C21_02920 [Gemmatimonadota bacterium]|nr:MAG: hypothetical protein DHS20C21_02920 [Gemmatimonadota bacterium]
MVYEGDKLFKREDEWVHEVADGLSLERGKPAGAIAVVYLTSGERITEWMPQSEIDQARSCSKSAHKDASPWKKWPGEMAKKTCLRRLMKKLPLDADKAAAIAEIETAEFGALLDRPARIGQSTATYEGSLGVDGIKNNLRDREASR